MKSRATAAHTAHPYSGYGDPDAQRKKANPQGWPGRLRYSRTNARSLRQATSDFGVALRLAHWLAHWLTHRFTHRLIYLAKRKVRHGPRIAGAIRQNPVACLHFAPPVGRRDHPLAAARLNPRVLFRKKPPAGLDNDTIPPAKSHPRTSYRFSDISSDLPQQSCRVSYHALTAIQACAHLRRVAAKEC